MNGSNTRLLVMLFLCAYTGWSSSVYAQDSWSDEQRSVMESISEFSDTTAPGGDGADVYGEFLTSDFSRWTIGTTQISTKSAWVEGVRDWFDDGWRVSDRDSEFIEITVDGDQAFVRRLVEETYSGPGDVSSGSKAALDELWVRGQYGWLLRRAAVHPMPSS